MQSKTDIIDLTNPLITQENILSILEIITNPANQVTWAPHPISLDISTANAVLTFFKTYNPKVNPRSADFPAKILINLIVDFPTPEFEEARTDLLQRFFSTLAIMGCESTINYLSEKGVNFLSPIYFSQIKITVPETLNTEEFKQFCQRIRSTLLETDSPHVIRRKKIDALILCVNATATRLNCPLLPPDLMDALVDQTLQIEVTEYDQIINRLESTVYRILKASTDTQRNLLHPYGPMRQLGACTNGIHNALNDIDIGLEQNVLSAFLQQCAKAAAASTFKLNSAGLHYGFESHVPWQYYLRCIGVKISSPPPSTAFTDLEKKLYTDKHRRLFFSFFLSSFSPATIQNHFIEHIKLCLEPCLNLTKSAKDTLIFINNLKKALELEEENPSFNIHHFIQSDINDDCTEFTINKIDFSEQQLQFIREYAAAWFIRQGITVEHYQPPANIDWNATPEVMCKQITKYYRMPNQLTCMIQNSQFSTITALNQFFQAMLRFLSRLDPKINLQETEAFFYAFIDLPSITALLENDKNYNFFCSNLLVDTKSKPLSFLLYKNNTLYKSKYLTNMFVQNKPFPEETLDPDPYNSYFNSTEFLDILFNSDFILHPRLVEKIINSADFQNRLIRSPLLLGEIFLSLRSDLYKLSQTTLFNNPGFYPYLMGVFGFNETEPNTVVSPPSIIVRDLILFSLRTPENCITLCSDPRGFALLQKSILSRKNFFIAKIKESPFSALTAFSSTEAGISLLHDVLYTIGLSSLDLHLFIDPKSISYIEAFLLHSPQVTSSIFARLCQSPKGRALLLCDDFLKEFIHLSSFATYDSIRKSVTNEFFEPQTTLLGNQAPISNFSLLLNDASCTIKIKKSFLIYLIYHDIEYFNQKIQTEEGSIFLALINEFLKEELPNLLSKTFCQTEIAIAFLAENLTQKQIQGFFKKQSALANLNHFSQDPQGPKDFSLLSRLCASPAGRTLLTRGKTPPLDTILNNVSCVFELLNFNHFFPEKPPAFFLFNDPASAARMNSGKGNNTLFHEVWQVLQQVSYFNSTALPPGGGPPIANSVLLKQQILQEICQTLLNHLSSLPDEQLFTTRLFDYTGAYPALANKLCLQPAFHALLLSNPLVAQHLFKKNTYWIDLILPSSADKTISSLFFLLQNEELMAIFKPILCADDIPDSTYARLQKALLSPQHASATNYTSLLYCFVRSPIGLSILNTLNLHPQRKKKQPLLLLEDMAFKTALLTQEHPHNPLSKNRSPLSQLCLFQEGLDFLYQLSQQKGLELFVQSSNKSKQRKQLLQTNLHTLFEIPEPTSVLYQLCSNQQGRRLILDNLRFFIEIVQSAEMLRELFRKPNATRPSAIQCLYSDPAFMTTLLESKLDGSFNVLIHKYGFAKPWLELTTGTETLQPAIPVESYEEMKRKSRYPVAPEPLVIPASLANKKLRSEEEDEELSMTSPLVASPPLHATNRASWFFRLSPSFDDEPLFFEEAEEDEALPSALPPLPSSQHHEKKEGPKS